MKFLNHLDLVENEARRLKMYRVAAGSYTPSVTTSGNIIMDTAAAIPKWWDGSAWRDFSYGTAGTMNWNIQSDSGSNIQVDQGDTLDLTGGTGISTITSGTGTAPIVTFNLQPATTSVLGGVIAGTNVSISNGTISVPNNTNTTYTGTVSTGITLTGTTFTVNSWGQVSLATNGSTAGETSGRYYRVATDTAGKLIVNVPWVDTNTNTNTQNAYAVSAADGTNTSREKIVLTGSGAAGATTDFVEIGAGTGLSIARSGDVITLTNTVVNTNTTYSAGSNLTLTGTTFSVPVLTNTTLGVAKTAHAALNNTTLASVGETATGRVYGIQKNTANQLVVQVPWANTNTNTQATYTLPVAAGTGNTAIINLTGGGAASGVASAVTFSGTTNEVAITESVGNNGTITIGLPDDVTIGNDLTVTNDALVSGNLTVTGDLTVNGTTTTLNTSVLEVEDNFIEINKVVSGASAANTANFGVTGERGSLANVSLKWIESNDAWYLDESSTNQNAGSLVSKKIIQEIWKGVSADSGTAAHVANTTDNTLSILGSNGITTSATGQAVTVSGSGLATGTVMTLSASSIGSASNKRANVTHALATKDVIVRTYLIAGEGGTLEEIYTNVTVMSTTVVSITFSAQPSSNVRVVVTAVRTPIAGTSVAYA
jgi:hypothetical protein